MSTRQAALTELKTRLEGILTADGYQTDAGALVFVLEEPVLGDDDPDSAIALVIHPDAPEWQGDKGFVTLAVEVQAHAKGAAADPWGSVEALLADIKTAVEQDHDLAGTLLPKGLERGATTVLKRESGSTTVGAGIEYRLQYAETWGAP